MGRNVKKGNKIMNKGEDDMEPVFQVEGTCLMIEVPGELDHPVSDRIRAQSDRIMEKNYIKTILFDFGKTTFMDSSGIGLIMGRYRALGMRQGCIRAVCVNSHIDRLLHLSGVHRYVEITLQSKNDEE